MRPSRTRDSLKWRVVALRDPNCFPTASPLIESLHFQILPNHELTAMAKGDNLFMFGRNDHEAFGSGSNDGRCFPQTPTPRVVRPPPVSHSERRVYLEVDTASSLPRLTRRSRGQMSTFRMGGI
jgi:hypothetical protein